jgi:hypothetical protein
MARAEHDEFLRELRARANFTLRLRLTPEPDDDGVIRNDGSVIRVRIEILLKNDGEKVAGETVLNVIAPRGFGLRWCGPRGEDMPGMEAPAETPELLTDADGRTVAAEYLKRSFPKVTLRSWYSRHARLSCAAAAARLA